MAWILDREVITMIILMIKKKTEIKHTLVCQATFLKWLPYLGPWLPRRLGDGQQSRRAESCGPNRSQPVNREVG